MEALLYLVQGLQEGFWFRTLLLVFSTCFVVRLTPGVVEVNEFYHRHIQAWHLGRWSGASDRRIPNMETT